MRGDAMSFAPLNICDEQWREAERPLLLPCAQEESRKQRFLVMASVFDNERSRAVGRLQLAGGGNAADALFCGFYVFCPALQHGERHHLSQARSC